MSEEFRHHIELRTRDLVRTGLSEKEAARQARLEFGHVETLKEQARASRGLGAVDQVRFSWLDVKLGLRMLVKHPALTVVAVFALAVGIPVGMAPMHLSSALVAPLPEDADNRVRAIRYWRADTTSAATLTYYDLDLWRRELATFDALGATRTGSYNATSDGGLGAPVAGAEVTASTFDVLGTPPLMGRALVASDEAVGAPKVAVVAMTSGSPGSAAIPPSPDGRCGSPRPRTPSSASCPRDSAFRCNSSCGSLSRGSSPLSPGEG